MSRQILLDTETTGLEPKNGHRVIEIGCVEVMHRQLTGRDYHVYLNPKRAIDSAAITIHGLTNDFLKDKPTFAEIAEELLAYLGDSELIIHNAPFDVQFLEHEFNLLQKPYRLADRHAITDTLKLARSLHPGQKNSLDALSKRYAIKHLERQKHGALLDAQILAHVYLAMTGGQCQLFEDGIELDGSAGPMMMDLSESMELPMVTVSAEQESAHQDMLKTMQALSGIKPAWLD